MSLDAGSVYAVLGAKMNPAGFVAYDAAMKKSIANAAAFEAAAAKSSARSSAAMMAVGKAAKVGVAASVAGLGAVMISSAAKAAGFEKKLAELKAVSGATEAQIKNLGKQALNLGAETGIGATKAADALVELSKGGLSVQDIMSGGLKGALALAAAGQLEVADAATYTVNALKLFGLGGKDATHVADALAQAANSTTADVADFGMALSQGGGAAKAAGLSFDETVVALEALAQAGVKNSDAGTSLKAALSQIANPTKKAADAAKDLGLSFFDAEGNMRPLPQISGMLQDKLGGLTRQQRLQALQTIAGTDGFRALLALYDQGPGKLEALERGLAKQGTAAKVAADKQEGTAGSMRKLGAAWESAQIVLGQELLPGVADGAEALAEKLREMAADGSLQEFGENLGEGIEAFADVLPIAVDGLGMLMSVINTFQGLLGALRGDFAGAADSMLGIVTTLMDGVREWVGVMAALPGPLGAPFRALEERIGSATDRVNKFREKLRGEQETVAIDVILKGDGTAKQKLAALKKEKLPPYIAQILARGDLTATQKLQRIQQFQISTKVANVLASTGSAQNKINALKRLPLPPRIARILGSNQDAAAKIAAVKSWLASIQNRTVTLTVNQVRNIIERRQLVPIGKLRASGRGPVGRESALVGEGRGPELVANPKTGRGAVVRKPTFMGLDPGDYVIPFEDRYRGRALGLMAAFAADAGIPGFKKGRKPKKRFVPKPRQFLRLPVQDYEDKAQKAQSRFDSLAQTAKDKDSKGRLTKNARRAKAKLAGARSELQKARAVRDKARRHAAQVKAAEDEIEIARQDMDLGNKRNDQGLYNSGLTRRRGALRQLEGLLRKALGFAGANTPYGREIRKALGQAVNDTQDLSKAETEFGDQGEPTLLTAAEQARLDQIEAGLALAELTEPLGDDEAEIRQLIAFREAVLGRVRGTGNNAMIAQAARDVKAARDQLSSLTGSGPSADLQAQLDQANRRREIAEEDARLSRAAVAAFGSSGDIGQGGANALAAAKGVTVQINTLHPGDPRTLDAVGRAATGGIGLQGNRISPRERVVV